MILPVNKISSVEVKVGEAYVWRELAALGSQIKQEIAARLKENLRSLKKLKENGHKGGVLKHKRFASSILFKQ